MKSKKLLIFIALLVANASILFGQYETQFKQRAGFVIRKTNAYGGNTPSGYNLCNPGDYGKFLHFKILGVYAIGSSSTYYALANTWMNTHKTCPLFHFNFFGLARILCQYSNEPAVQSTELNYLKLVFSRTDSYNAFTGEGTENQINMSRPAAYLFCQIVKARYPDSVAVWNVNQRMIEMKNYIMWYSKRMLEVGNGEFNSTTYDAYSIVPWLNLYDYAQDNDIKLASKAVLDYFSCQLAVHYMRGQIGGTDLRGNATASFGGSSGYLGYLWFGDNPCTDTTALATKYYIAKEQVHAVVAALSTYRPPLSAVKLALGKLTVPAMYNNSKPSYLLGTGSYVKHTDYIDKQYNLGCGYYPYGGYSNACYGIVSWKLIAPTTPAVGNIQYISGMGGLDKGDGRYRSPFDQFVHHNNVLIQMTRVPVNYASLFSNVDVFINNWICLWEESFVQRFPGDLRSGNSGAECPNAPAGVLNPVGSFSKTGFAASSWLYIKNNTGALNTATSGNWYFVDLDSIYLAVRSLYNPTPVYATGKFTDAGATDAICGFVMEVGNKMDFADFAAFQTNITSNASLDKSQIGSNKISYTSSRGDIIEATYNTSGSFTEPIFDWGFGPTAPQNEMLEAPTNDTVHSFLQPVWPSGVGYGKIASWKVNSVSVNLATPWAVFEGPHLLVKNGILRVFDGIGDSTHLDYTGSVPVYYPLTGESKPMKSDEESIVIYPNPSDGIVYISGDYSLLNGSTAELFNTLGQMVFSSKLNGSSMLNISGVENGVYMLRLLKGQQTIKAISILKK